MTRTADHCHTHATAQPPHLHSHSRRSVVVALASTAAVSSGPVIAQSEVSPQDERFMLMALDEARQGDYAFGCVITRDDKVIARGRNLGKTNDVRPHMARWWRSGAAWPITAARCYAARRSIPPANRA